MRFLSRLISGNRTWTQSQVALTPSVGYTAVPSGRVVAIVDCDYTPLTLVGDLPGSPFMRWSAQFAVKKSATDLFWVQLWDLTTSAEIAVITAPVTCGSQSWGSILATPPAAGQLRLQARYKTTASPGTVKLLGWSLDLWG